MRRVLLLIVLLLFTAVAASAQIRGGGFHHRGGGFHDRGGYDGFAAPMFPSAYDFFYPSHFAPYPYPAPMPQEAPARVFVAEATHDWRNWPPPRKIITGPLTREEADRLAAASM